SASSPKAETGRSGPTASNGFCTAERSDAGKTIGAQSRSSPLPGKSSKDAAGKRAVSHQCGRPAADGVLESGDQPGEGAAPGVGRAGFHLRHQQPRDVGAPTGSADLARFSS